MNKILLITGEEKTFSEAPIFKSNNKYNIKNCLMFSGDRKIDKILRNLIFPFSTLGINKKLKSELKKDYDTIIIFDSAIKINVIKSIRFLNKNIRIILYLRNKYSYVNKKIGNIHDLEKYNIEIWSYNDDDCNELGFYYNSQFWNKYLLKKSNKNIYDFVFLGYDKSRTNVLNEIYNYCEKNNLNTYFYIVPKSAYSYDKNTENKYMKYEDYLSVVSSSKCIIDLVSAENSGLTLRPLESLFMRKKLITNFNAIKKYDFYSKKNIFIIGEDNIENLFNFINSDYEEISDDIVNKYDFNNWITNFEKDE